MKTMSNWHESKLNLTEFLKIGDSVADDIAEYFFSVLPPICWNGSFIQIGEPYDTNGHGRFTYMTLKKIKGQWQYAGLMVNQGRTK